MNRSGPTDRPPTPSDDFEAVEPFDLRRRSDSDDEELDMTPMVDVTFLLLIFFMVTAAFAMQKSIEVPAPDQQESASQQIEPDEIDDDFVVVDIDRDGTVWVNGTVAPSKQELLIQLEEARLGTPGSESSGATGLLVKANPDSHHERVVMVLDAGNAAKMSPIRLADVEEGTF